VTSPTIAVDSRYVIHGNEPLDPDPVHPQVIDEGSWRELGADDGPVVRGQRGDAAPVVVAEHLVFERRSARCAEPGGVHRARDRNGREDGEQQDGDDTRTALVASEDADADHQQEHDGCAETHRWPRVHGPGCRG